MTVPMKKPERKWLDWSVHANVDQPKIQINPAAETGNHAQLACQMPRHRHAVPKRLDLCPKQRQHAGECVLLGECRIKTFSISGGTSQERAHTMTRPEITANQAPVPRSRLGLPVPVTICGVTYPSQTAAALALGVSARTVSAAKKRDALDRVGLDAVEPLTIRGVTYPSQTAAALALGVSTRAVGVANKRDTLDSVGLGNAEPLTIRGVTYPSHTAAALALGVSTRAVSAAKKRDALDRVGLRKKAS
jgi:phage protein U